MPLDEGRITLVQGHTVWEGMRERDDGMEMPRNDRSQESTQVLILGQDGMALGGTD